jgi:hypothetical protein
VFVLAAGVYVGIWAISTLLVTSQTSYYYTTEYPLSPYIEVNSQSPTTCDSTVYRTIESSLGFFTSAQLKDAKTIALSLIFSWLMWKLPLAVFMLHIIYDTVNSRIVKYVTWAIAVLLMLAADIVLTIFIPTIYT